MKQEVRCIDPQPQVDALQPLFTTSSRITVKYVKVNRVSNRHP